MAKFLGLENVEDTARRNPGTFFLPPENERRSQKIGASVRLHFLIKEPDANEPRAERMWVRITQQQGFLKPYKGTLENDPIFIDDLGRGDEITFKPCHIAQTIIKKGDPRWIDSGTKKAFVSNLCFEVDAVIRYLYREEPDKEEDSGWRMFTGKEPQEYCDDPKNIRLASVAYMLDRDPSLLEPLKNPVGVAFERKDKGMPWRKVVN
jgi:hypothetical protein